MRIIYIKGKSRYLKLYVKLMELGKNSLQRCGPLCKCHETLNNGCNAPSKNPGVNCHYNLYENGPCDCPSCNNIFINALCDCFEHRCCISENNCYNKIAVSELINDENKTPDRKRKINDSAIQIEPIRAQQVPFIPGQAVTARFAEATTFRAIFTNDQHICSNPECTNNIIKVLVPTINELRSSPMNHGHFAPLNNLRSNAGNASRFAQQQPVVEYASHNLRLNALRARRFAQQPAVEYTL